ncbi:MAG: energy transducer TonB [Wenzhouxiangellaceae bacterium]|nr:energy transducer TonB [Wenzhouxiangellaceae bacterium]
MPDRGRGPAREGEILTAAIVLAILLHVAVITQLHFDWLDAGREQRAPDLDVILVDAASETAPEDADFLAQANQRGGGIEEDVDRPSAPPERQPAQAPQPEPAEASDPEPPAAETPDPVVSIEDPAAVRPPETAEAPSDPVEAVDARELVRQSLARAQAAPDPLSNRRVLPERPRRKFITANTREHLYASYMRSWVAKVERVGNMNYPDQARQQNLSGSLVLSVDVLADGSIERVQILRSSGFDLLDEAAVRIVRLAAPYAALPPEIREETDVLTITRTWQFSPSSGLN